MCAFCNTHFKTPSSIGSNSYGPTKLCVLGCVSWRVCVYHYSWNNSFITYYTYVQGSAFPIQVKYFITAHKYIVQQQWFHPIKIKQQKPKTMPKYSKLATAGSVSTLVVMFVERTQKLVCLLEEEPLQSCL